MLRDLIRRSGIYALCDSTGAVRYVGQSIDVDGRIAQHRRDAKAGKNHDWCSPSNDEPCGLLLERAPAVWLCALEREWIRYGRLLGWDLVNRTIGGNAGTSFWSDASRAKMSARHAGEGNPMYGRPSPMKGRKLSAESRAKVSIAARGRPSSMKGKHMSLEARAKISASRLGYQAKTGFIEPGTRFERLVVLRYSSGGSAGTKRRYLCRCDCGNEIETEGRSLRKGYTRSCGCLRREIVSAVQKERRRQNQQAST